MHREEVKSVAAIAQAYKEVYYLHSSASQVGFSDCKLFWTATHSQAIPYRPGSGVLLPLWLPQSNSNNRWITHARRVTDTFS